MTDELILSASSAQSYMACHHRWYLQYIENEQGVPSMQSAVGTAVHAGAEVYYDGMLDTESAIPDEGVRALALGAADLAYLLEIEAIVDSDEDLLKMRPVVGRVTTVYIEEVGSRIWQSVLGAEQEAMATIEGIAYSGHLDVMQDGIVRDTKVLGQKPRFPQKYLFAMTGYDLLYEALLGDRAAARILDIVIRLKRDRPRYDPIDFGETTRRQAADFARDLTEVADGIARADFTPTGIATGECRYCPVRFACDHFMGGTN